MDDNRHFYEKPAFWPRLLGGIFLLLFVIAFRLEIWQLLRLLFDFILLLIGKPYQPLSANTPQLLLALAANAVLYVVIYSIFLWWVSLFILPAQNPSERRWVFERLIEYVFHLHGPAVFIRNGKLIARKEEVLQEETGLGRYASLAFMDLASAIVAERALAPKAVNQAGDKVPAAAHPSPIRALGPGIGFLYPGERIQGAVDLRKQSRKLDNVRGFTNDGIELETSVSIVFTLGQAADVQTVVNYKDTGLRVLTIDPDTMKISGITDDLDPDDKIAIEEHIKGQGHKRTNEKAFELPLNNRPPFNINEDRIISAVLSQPRNIRDGRLEKWADLPARVAVSVLRDELSHVSYDQLYSLDRPRQECYLYDTFKPDFRRKVKNLGVLSYQFVQRKDGNPPEKDTLFNASEYWIWDVQQLSNPKSLRDRGIKVIDVGFSDFNPIDKTIPEQRFDSWRSHWEKKTELTNADYDLEVIRIKNHARAQAQRDIIYNLSQVFKLPGYTREAMAIHIFQALESAASNPATNRLLPRDTIEMLRNFQRLLMDDERGGNADPHGVPPAIGGSQERSR